CWRATNPRRRSGVPSRVRRGQEAVRWSHTFDVVGGPSSGGIVHSPPPPAPRRRSSRDHEGAGSIHRLLPLFQPGAVSGKLERFAHFDTVACYGKAVPHLREDMVGESFGVVLHDEPDLSAEERIGPFSDEPPTRILLRPRGLQSRLLAGVVVDRRQGDRPGVTEHVRSLAVEARTFFMTTTQLVLRQP